MSFSARSASAAVAPLEDDSPVDYYELLQISPNAEPETIHRVYRLLAQRFHPDNQETGSESRFQALHEAYSVLSDSARRAQYDVAHAQRRNDRFRLIAKAPDAVNDFEMEQLIRLTALEVLYTRRRVEPANPGVYVLDLEEMIGRAREHLEFTIWFLIQKNLIKRGDDSRLTITADGVEYFEQNYQGHLQRRRLHAVSSL